MHAKWITPAVTAMDKQGRIDMEANKRIYDFLIEKGMDGILLLGSIGEFFAIPMEDKKRLIREALSYIDHRVTVYVGTCEMNLEACIGLTNYALEQGADGAMVISPYYFNLPDNAILHFYDTLAEKACGPLLLYNFPERTGYDLRPELVGQLVSRHENIVGIKDTVGTMGHTRALIQKVKKKHPQFLVYSGFDEFFGHNVLSGGDGCIAGLSNFAPEIAAGYAEWPSMMWPRNLYQSSKKPCICVGCNCNLSVLPPCLQLQKRKRRKFKVSLLNQTSYLDFDDQIHFSSEQNMQKKHKLAV